MELSQLFKEYADAFDHTNFQHKGMSDDEFDALARKSFLRLTKKQQDDALASWFCFLGNIREEWETVLYRDNPKYHDEVELWVSRFRFMCQTNLFFLCHLLGYTKVTDHKYDWYNAQTKAWEKHNTHEEICNEFFVRKDPVNFGTFEAFAIAADAKKDFKERLLLVP